MWPPRRRPRRAGRTAVPDRHARGPGERRRLGSGDRRLDQCRPPPAGDRARVPDPLHDRRLRRDRRANARDRRHEAVGQVPRNGRLPRRWHRARRARAGQAGVDPRRPPDCRRTDDRRGRDRDRRDRGPGRGLADRSADQAERLAAHPARKPRPRRLRGQADRRPAPPHRPRSGVRHRAGCVRRRDGEGDRARRRRRDPLRGPGRGPGDAGDAAGDRGDHRRGPRRRSGAHHRRAVLRRHTRVHGRPRHAGSVPRRPDRRPAGGRAGDDRRRRRGAARRPLRRRDRRAATELVAAPAAVRRRRARQYAYLVSSASEGAVTTPPRT